MGFARHWYMKCVPWCLNPPSCFTARVGLFDPAGVVHSSKREVSSSPRSVFLFRVVSVFLPGLVFVDVQFGGELFYLVNRVVMLGVFGLWN